MTEITQLQRIKVDSEITKKRKKEKELTSIKALNRYRMWLIVEVDNRSSHQDDIISKDEKELNSKT